MQFGIYLPNFGSWGDPEAMVALAVDAEEAGWDGFFIWDHILWDSRDGRHDVVDPWVALGAVAQATSTIRIGTTVTPVPRRRPHKLARETVTVDRLSHGRFTFGIGSGPGGVEFEGMGEAGDAKTRGAMLDEAMDVIASLWSGENVTHNGPHYRIDGAKFGPTPVQRPRIPVWVGGFWPNKKPMRRAAQWDGVMPLVRDRDDELGQLKACIEYVASHRDGDKPFDVVYPGVTPSDPGDAGSTVKPYADIGVTWWLEAIAPFRYDEGWDEPWDTERLRSRVLAGPPKL